MFLRKPDAIERAWLLCILGVGIVLLPYASSGFYSDDIINSTSPGAAAAAGMSAWEVVRKLHTEWITTSGRFFPVAIFSGVVSWLYASSHVMNRALQLSLIVANLALCARLLRILSGSRVLALVFVGFIAASFQARSYHDPMTSYSPLSQEIVLLLLGTIYFFLTFLQSWRPLPYVAGLACHAVALATYELSFVAGPILALAVFLRYGRRGLRSWLGLAGHGLLVGIFICLMFHLKAHVSSGYKGTAINLHGAISLTFFRQLSAAFPLAYVMFDPQKLFRHFPWPAADLWALGLVGFASLAASLKFALRRITERPANAGLLLGVGLLMLGLPAAIVSASEKYQEQVRWGLGYLPVYLQYFGLAIVAATVACSICAFAARRRARRFHDCFAVTSAVGFSAAAILSFFANRYVVELRNAQLRYPRDFIESAARHGFFKDVPAESIVLKDRLAPWDTDVFYLQHSGRKLHVMTPERWLSRERDTVFGRKPSQGVYALDYESDEREDGPGWAVLGRLSEVYFQKNGKSASIVSRMVEDPQAYVEAPATLARRPSPLLTNGWRFLSGDAMAPAVFDLRAALRIGDRWANTQLPRGGYRDFTGPRRMPAPASACGLLLQEPKAPDASVVPVLTARAFTGKENIPLEQVAGVLFDGDVVDGQTVRLPSGNSSRVSLSAAGLGQSSLGLALYVYPTGGQPRYAAIVSNHGNWRGFGLEQDGGTNPAQFQLTIGNGNSWKPLGPVSIPPGEWSLILLGVEPSRTTLRVIRGETDIRRELDSAPAASLSDSDLVYLGNWPAGDRPFIGRIGHVSVADHPFDASQTEAIVSEFHRWTREAPQ